jgi:hypothetical protein
MTPSSGRATLFESAGPSAVVAVLDQVNKSNEMTTVEGQ